MPDRSRAFGWLLIVGAALRIAAIHLRPLGAMVVAPDEVEYLEIAQNLAAGLGFSFQGEPTAYRDFLFPAVAALVLRLSGSLTLVFYVQAALDLGTALLLCRLGRRRFSESAAIMMGVVWLFYPAAILYSSLFLTETLFVFLWVLALALYDQLEAGKLQIGDALALGAALGLLMLARTVGVLLLFAIMFYVLLIRYEWPFRRRLRTSLLMAAACLGVVLPWAVRNVRVLHHFALNTNSGINLYIGNNPHATGAYRFDDVVTAPLQFGRLDEGTRNQVALRLAADYFRKHTREAVSLWGRKFAHFWSTDMSVWSHYAPDPQRGSLAAELRQAPPLALFALAASFFFIMIFGTSGYYLIRHFDTRGLFILQLALGTAAALATYGLPRYHFPFIPAMLMGSAALYEAAINKRESAVTGPVWSSVLPARRLFLLFTLGMFAGIWLFEIMTIAGV